MSVLSRESEDEIEVSAQYKLVILLSPKTILLLPVATDPLGELDLPALFPKNKLFEPVVTSTPVAYPYPLLLLPVTNFKDC